MTAIERETQFFKQALDEAIDNLKQREPRKLYEPVVYTLNMGGKRIRPVLLLLAHAIYSNKREHALPAALAIEIFHNFTLLHDDMMDNAAKRRNNNTVHIQYSNNTAILSGDAMSILAYEYLTKAKCHSYTKVIELFTQTALEICEGQQYDMDYETRSDITIPQYLEMIRLKTAVLLGCSMKMGALIAEAPAHEADALYDFGINMGMAFQLQDDYLDSFGDEKTFGKAIGGDIVANKKTFMLLKALETASPETATELNSWLEMKEFDRNDKILAIKKLYEKLNIPEATKELMNTYYQNALIALGQINSEHTLPFRELAASLLEREV
jgi:geranylgeranyl diphosphate synthase, type II